MSGLIRFLWRMMVDPAVAGIQEQLEQGMRVDLLGTSAHLHWKHEKRNERQQANQLRQAGGPARETSWDELTKATGKKHDIFICGARINRAERTTPRAPLCVQIAMTRSLFVESTHPQALHLLLTELVTGVQFQVATQSIRPT